MCYPHSPWLVFCCPCCPSHLILGLSLVAPNLQWLTQSLGVTRADVLACPEVMGIGLMQVSMECRHSLLASPRLPCHMHGVPDGWPHKHACSGPGCTHG